MAAWGFESGSVMVVRGLFGTVGKADPASSAQGFSNCMLVEDRSPGTLVLDNTFPAGGVVMFPVAVAFVIWGFDTTCGDGMTGSCGTGYTESSAAWPTEFSFSRLLGLASSAQPGSSRS